MRPSVFFGDAGLALFDVPLVAIAVVVVPFAKAPAIRHADEVILHVSLVAIAVIVVPVAVLTTELVVMTVVVGAGHPEGRQRETQGEGGEVLEHR
jgi:hypothetical protein